MKALSIRQPWAYAILALGKDVENREWTPRNPGRRFRGRFLLHAGLTFDRYDLGAVRDILERLERDPALAPAPWQRMGNPTHPYARGAIVGTARVVDVVDAHPSPWFFGPVGLVLSDVQAIEKPIPLKGKLGFFEVPETIATEAIERSIPVKNLDPLPFFHLA